MAIKFRKSPPICHGISIAWLMIGRLLLTKTSIGYPGFHIKMYDVNRASGCWQGMYQWESWKALEEYKHSFVFRMMNKRAIKSTITSFEFNNQSLSKFIENHNL